MDAPTSFSPDAALQADTQALTSALASLVMPMARLAVARGLRFAAAEELVKQAFVKAAIEALRQAHPDLAEHRMVSRISATTGIHRREVNRLQALLAEGPATSARPTLATEIFTRWITDPAYKSASGTPLPLPRQGDGISFEELAHSITRDVHPRTLLDELCRLGLAHWDEASDLVMLQGHAFVPRGDTARMLAFLGDNVGDHLQAAVCNVLSSHGTPPHFEQAVFSDELSEQALLSIKALVQAHWQQLLADSIPLLEALIEQDRLAGRPQDQRVRIGLFSYSEPSSGPSIP